MRKGWVDRDYIGNIGDESLADPELHAYMTEVPPDAMMVTGTVCRLTASYGYLRLPKEFIGKRINSLIWEDSEDIL